MTDKTVRTIAFIAMFLGMCTTFLVFMLRYGWYTTPQNAIVLDIGYAVFLAICGIAWFFFPSKVLVLTACLALFFYPSIYDAHDFVGIDWKFLPFIAICILLVVIAIELRRKDINKRSPG